MPITGRTRRSAIPLDLLPRGLGAAPLLVGDAIGAILFAAGLAGAVAHARPGFADVLPWLALALIAGVARAVFGYAATSVGNRGGQVATALRAVASRAPPLAAERAARRPAMLS